MQNLTTPASANLSFERVESEASVAIARDRGNSDEALTVREPF